MALISAFPQRCAEPATRRAAGRQLPWIAAAGVLVLAGCARNVGDGLRDSWEAPPGQRGSAARPCRELPREHVLAVPASARPAAIARLERAAAVELSPEEAAQLLGLAAPSAEPSWAVGLIQQAVDRMEQQKKTVMEQHVGSWSLADERRLEELKTLRADALLPTLRPFLARAIAKNESTGAFSASLCGDELWVLHGSLGHHTPPSVRLPVVVFLASPPAKVHPVWSMAE